MAYKGIKKILCAMLCVGVIFSSTGISFGLESISVEKEEEAERVFIHKGMEDMTDQSGETPTTVTEKNNIIVADMKTGKEEWPASVIKYNNVDDLLVNRAAYCGYSQKVLLNKGTVTMMVKAAGSTGTTSVVFGVFRDAEMKKPVDTAKMNKESAAQPTCNVITIPKKGEYYVGLYSPVGKEGNVEFSPKVSVVNMNGADRQIYNKKQIAVGQKEAGTKYFKFKAMHTGYIKVMTSDDAEVNMTLCNVKKKALSDRTVNTNETIYGVKKNKVYQIKVRAAYNSNGGYLFKVNNVKVIEKSGAKKNRAVNIGKNKIRKGVIAAGSGVADWYKFKLGGEKQVKVILKGDTNKKLNIKLYKGGKILDEKVLVQGSQGITIKSEGKLSRGIYHIKVSRQDKGSSGYYLLKWK